MRRTRARVLAAAIVIGSAGVASASLDLIVTNYGVPRGVIAGPFGDGGLDADADADAVGSDTIGEGGFDGGNGPGSDAADAGVFDAPPVGFDAGDAPGFDGGEAGVDGGFDAGGVDVGASFDAGAGDAQGPGTLLVDPATFDFGEVRVGTPEPTIDITLTNIAPAGSASLQITSFELRASPPALTLARPALPISLAPGSSVNATLTLATAADAVLAGEFIDITADGAMMPFPVTGKVVTPHSIVAPPNALDLGTACVGTEVSGTVRLMNDGTATLMVDPPVMDQSFVAAAPNTPGALAPGDSRTATVTPMMTASGAVAGTLTWRDDVPSEYRIAVKLDYVASGTALSPRGLDFGQVPVELPGGAQYIKLQNCDLTATQIKLESLKTKQGTLGAWELDPRVGFTKQLAAKQEQAIAVTFKPPARGRYEADLTVQTASGKQIVHLVGDATGRDFDNTSFYACACNGPGASSRGAGGWPIAFAIVIVICRRRRGSSSPR